MARGLERIEEEIRSLSPAEKVVLLRTLIAELDAPADPDVDRAWLEEAQRRHRELAEGKVKGVSGERVFENLKSRLQWEPEARLSRRVPGQCFVVSNLSAVGS